METDKLVKTAFKMVSNYYGIPVESLHKEFSSLRKRKHIYPRQVLEYCLYNYVAKFYPNYFSKTKIGEITGTHHSTVINSIKIVDRDITTRNDLGKIAFIIVHRIDRKLFKIRKRSTSFDPAKEIEELQQRITKIIKQMAYVNSKSAA